MNRHYREPSRKPVTVESRDTMGRRRTWTPKEDDADSNRAEMKMDKAKKPLPLGKDDKPGPMKRKSEVRVSDKRMGVKTKRT